MGLHDRTELPALLVAEAETYSVYLEYPPDKAIANCTASIEQNDIICLHNPGKSDFADAKLGVFSINCMFYNKWPLFIPADQAIIRYIVFIHFPRKRIDIQPAVCCKDLSVAIMLVMAQAKYHKICSICMQ